MSTNGMSYGDKVTAVRRALAREGIQMTAGQPREAGGRFTGGVVAGGSKPFARPSPAATSRAVMDTRGDVEAAKAMLAGLTIEEKMALDAGSEAERKWEKGSGDPASIKRQARRADETIRRAIAAREARGEAGGLDAMTTLGYLQRVMQHGGSMYTMKALPYGGARRFPDDTDEGMFEREN